MGIIRVDEKAQEILKGFYKGGYNKAYNTPTYAIKKMAIELARAKDDKESLIKYKKEFGYLFDL